MFLVHRELSFREPRTPEARNLREWSGVSGYRLLNCLTGAKGCIPRYQRIKMLPAEWVLPKGNLETAAETVETIHSGLERMGS